MGVTISWDHKEAGVMLYTVEGRWTWEDLFAAIDQAREMADSIPNAQVHSIIDIRAGSMFPHNALVHFRRMSNGGANPKLKAGTAVLVGDNFFVKALVDIMSRWNYRSMQHFAMTTTLDDARVFLAQQLNEQGEAYTA